jgi:hypothetical protein
VPHRIRAGGRAGRSAPVNAAAVFDASVSTAGGPISAPMVAALEGAWAAIRARHPEVPAAVIVLGAGSIGTAGGLRLGHIAAMRWSQPEHTDAEPVEGEQDLTAPPPSVRLPEVFVGGEGLARGPAHVLGTLLHEAAHAPARVRGIKDTSRQGRWRIRPRPCGGLGDRQMPYRPYHAPQDR